MIVHQRYLLPQQLDLLLILTQVLLACFDVVLTKENIRLKLIQEKTIVFENLSSILLSFTYLDRLYALLDVDNLGRVRDIPVHVLAYDTGSSRNELKV